MRIVFLSLLALCGLAFAIPAQATCTASSPRGCIGTLSEVYIDNGGSVYVVPSTSDVANVTGASPTCLATTLPDGTASGNALVLRRSNPSFDQILQILLVAKSSFLSTKVIVTTYSCSIFTCCEISDASF